MGIIGRFLRKLLRQGFKYSPLETETEREPYRLYRIKGFSELPELVKEASKASTGTLESDYGDVLCRFYVRVSRNPRSDIVMVSPNPDPVYLFRLTCHRLDGISLTGLLEFIHDLPNLNSFRATPVPGHCLTSTHVFLMKAIAAVMGEPCHNGRYFVSHEGGLPVPADWPMTHEEGGWNCKMLLNNTMEVEFMVGDKTFLIDKKLTDSVYKNALKQQMENIIKCCASCNIKEVFFVFPEITDCSFIQLPLNRDELPPFIEEVLETFQEYNLSLRSPTEDEWGRRTSQPAQMGCFSVSFDV